VSVFHAFARNSSGGNLIYFLRPGASSGAKRNQARYQADAKTFVRRYTPKFFHLNGPFPSNCLGRGHGPSG
jgi:hypothetical protein